MTSYWGDSKIIPPPKALPFKESLLVLGKLLSDPGSDIMMGQDINMRDSISMQMLQQPCRALGCKHIQCFDFEAYLHINKSRPSSEYSCPICNQVSNPSKIYVDTIFLCLLKILPEDSNISIMKDGRFDIRVNQPQREIIVVDDDDDEDGFVATTSMSSSSGILQCTGSVVELSYIVPFTTSKSKKNRTSLTELTTASLDDVLHLMNVENAWGVNSIPGSTMELQKCIRAKRPFASSSNDGLKYLLQQVDGVGTVRAGKIVEHFYKILQGKLNGYLEFIQARSLFQENSLNLSLSSPIIVEFLKKMGRLKPVSEPPLPSTTAASPTKSSKSKSKSKRIKDTSSQQEEADNLSMPPPAAVASNSYIDVEADAADTGSSAAAATASRKRANSVISVASSAYESELESAVVITSQASQPSQPAYQQDSRVLHYSSQSAAAGRAKGSSAICGEGIADVAILPKLTRRHSSGSIAQDSDVLSMSQRNTVIDLSDSNDAAVAESVSPVGSPNSKNSRNPSSPSKRRGHKRRRSEDSSSIPQVSVSSFSSGSSSGGGGMDVVMEEADVVTVSSASVQGAADASRHRRRRVGVVDVDADDDLQVRGPFMQTALGAVSSAATVSSTSSAERSVSAEAAAPADAPKPAPTPAEAPIVPIMAAVSMSRAAPPMQAPGGPSSSSDASSAARRPASSTASVRNTASSQVAARVQQVGNQLASPRYAILVLMMCFCSVSEIRLFFFSLFFACFPIIVQTDSSAQQHPRSLKGGLAATLSRHLALGTLTSAFTKRLLRNTTTSIRQRQIMLAISETVRLTMLLHLLRTMRLPSRKPPSRSECQTRCHL